MIALAETQGWWQAALLSPDAPGPAQIEARLIGSVALPAEAGFGIYRRAFSARIRAALREQFPALCHALGQPLFDDFVDDYVQRQPPRSHTLHDLGARFADFLEAQRPDRAEAREIWIDFMLDLARFERQVFLMHDMAGGETCGLAGAGVPDHRLRLQPAVAVGSYRFNVAEYQHAVRHGRPTPTLMHGLQTVALVRKDYLVRILALSAGEADLFAAMTKGLTLAEAAMGLSGNNRRKDKFSLAEIRERWIENGIFLDTDRQEIGEDVLDRLFCCAS